MKKLVILQTVVPDYRKKVFNYINEELGAFFSLYAGEQYFEKSIKSDQTISFRETLKNLYFFKRKFLFQTGMWNEVIADNIMVLEMNPRILSNWLILVLRKMFKKQTLLWGHAWPRSGSKGKADFLRHLMRSLGSQIVVYTETQKTELKKKMPEKPIFSAPNSVFYKEEMSFINDENSCYNIIYVGRLIKSKKPMVLIKAFEQAIKHIPENCNLLIVGDGPERNSLEEYIERTSLSKRIKTFGHISEYETLKKLYDTSIISVSPGYIGLSVTQSFGFGVPMIVSKDENHSPEIEAVIDGFNAVYFETDNVDSLSRILIDEIRNKKQWVAKREEICNFCKENYSVEVMARHFIKSPKLCNI